MLTATAARPRPPTGFPTGTSGSLMPESFCAPATAVQWAPKVCRTNGPINIPLNFWIFVSQLIMEIKSHSTYISVISVHIFICKMEIFQVPFCPFLPIFICIEHVRLRSEESDKDHNCSWSNWTAPWIHNALHCLSRKKINISLYLMNT